MGKDLECIASGMNENLGFAVTTCDNVCFLQRVGTTGGQDAQKRPRETQGVECRTI